jgi:hypothetical protein
MEVLQQLDDWHLSGGSSESLLRTADNMTLRRRQWMQGLERKLKQVTRR